MERGATLGIMAEKRCTGCHKLLPLSEFYNDKNRRDGKTRDCKACSKTRALKYYYANPEECRKRVKKYRDDNAEEIKKKMHEIQKRYRDQRYDRGLKKKYGMTLKDYNKMLKSQNGVCAICGETGKAGKKIRLALDHNHKTGQIRALLCNKCNNGLGCFNDDTERMKAAIAYLEKHNSANWQRDLWQGKE